MINSAIAWHTFRQHHWIRMSLVCLVLLFVFVSADGVYHNQLIVLTPFLVWLLGAGIIGRDMSSGVNHLLFTRPVSRRDYVLTKWASLTASVMTVLCCALAVWALGKLAYHSPLRLDWQLWKDLALSLWIAAVLSTVVVLFSTLMAGWGDLALLLYVHVVWMVLDMSFLRNHFRDFDGIMKWALRVIWPGAKAGLDHSLGKTLTPEVFAFDTAVAAVFLLSAIYCINRKDVGYSSD